MERKGITPGLAYILGALRDGTINIKRTKEYSHYRLDFHSKSKDWLINISRILEKHASNKPQISGITRKYGLYWKLVLNDKKFINDLVNISGFHTMQSTWNTPKVILESSAEVKSAYISGFFDAEGCVTKLTSRELWNIGFYHTWENSAECPPLEDIKNMLSDMDIRSNRITVKTLDNRLPLFCLRITDKKSVMRFCNEIFSINPDKKKRMKIINLSRLTPVREREKDDTGYPEYRWLDIQWECGRQ